MSLKQGSYDETLWKKFIGQRDNFTQQFKLSVRKPEWIAVENRTSDVLDDAQWDAAGANGFVVRAYTKKITTGTTLTWSSGTPTSETAGDNVIGLYVEFLQDTGPTSLTLPSWSTSTLLGLSNTNINYYDYTIPGFAHPTDVVQLEDIEIYAGTVGGVQQYNTSICSPCVNFDESYFYVFAMGKTYDGTHWNATVFCWKAPISDPSTWTFDSSWITSTGVIADNGVEDVQFLAYGGKNPVVYMVIGDGNSGNCNTHIRYVSNGSIYDTDIYYPYYFYSFDVQWFIDNSDDPSINPLNANQNIRHLIVAVTKRPPYYQYTQDVSGNPIGTPIETGGIISWVVRPPPRPTADGDPGASIPAPFTDSGSTYATKIVFPYHEEIEVLNPFTTYQNRLYGKISVFNTSSDSSVLFDTLVVTSMGSEGDWSPYDSTVHYPIALSYRSKDGINWTQGERDFSSFDGTTTGVTNYGEYNLPFASINQGYVLVQSGYHFYYLTKTGTAFRQSSYPYYPFHPDTQIDVTHYVRQIDSEFQQTRQTKISLDDIDGHITNTLHFSAGYSPHLRGMELLHYIGNEDSSIMELMSREIVDQINIRIEGDTNYQRTVDITASGFFTNMSDRYAAVDAITHDSPVIRNDIFTEIGGVQNAGIGHIAPQLGTFGSDENNHLKLLTNNGLGVAFSTFKDTIENGIISSGIILPSGVTLSAPNTESCVFGGIVFRGIDKNNWYAFVLIMGNSPPYNPSGQLALMWPYPSSGAYPASSINVNTMFGSTYVFSTPGSSITDPEFFVRPIFQLDSGEFTAIIGGAEFQLGVEMVYDKFHFMYWNPLSTDNLKTGSPTILAVPPTFEIDGFLVGLNATQAMVASNPVTYGPLMSGYAGVVGYFPSTEDSTAAPDPTTIVTPVSTPPTVPPPGGGGTGGGDGGGGGSITPPPPPVTGSYEWNFNFPNSVDAGSGWGSASVYDDWQNPAITFSGLGEGGATFSSDGRFCAPGPTNPYGSEGFGVSGPGIYYRSMVGKLSFSSGFWTVNSIRITGHSNQQYQPIGIMVGSSTTMASGDIKAGQWPADQAIDVTIPISGITNELVVAVVDSQGTNAGNVLTNNNGHTYIDHIYINYSGSLPPEATGWHGISV